jgi:hypothetical protein
LTPGQDDGEHALPNRRLPLCTCRSCVVRGVLERRDPNAVGDICRWRREDRSESQDSRGGEFDLLQSALAEAEGIAENVGGAVAEFVRSTRGPRVSDVHATSTPMHERFLSARRVG